MNIVDETHVTIRRYADVVAACQKGQTLASQLGLSENDQINVVLTVLTMAREIPRCSRQGEVILRSFRQSGRRGILINVDGVAEEMIMEQKV